MYTKTIRSLFVLIMMTTLVGCATLPLEPVLPFEPQNSISSPTPDWAFEGAMYEINLRSFTPERTFQAATAKLPELVELGIKTIWLMPFQPHGKILAKGISGSPYSQIDKRGCAEMYGTMDDFRAFRDEVHRLGMKLILDVTLSNTSWDHPWITENPEWYRQDNQGNILQVGPFNDIAYLDHNHPEVRQELLDLLLYWIIDENLDGFRLDAVVFIDDTFWSWILPQVFAAKPVLLLAESMEDWAFLAASGFNLVYLYNQTIHHMWKAQEQLGEHLLDYELNSMDETGGVPFLRFLSNHDMGWEGRPPRKFGGLEGAEAATVLSYSLPGIPMIHNGQEVGYNQEKPEVEEFDFHINIDWDIHPEVREFYTKYLHLWKSTPALQHGSLQVYPSGKDSRVVVISRHYRGQNVGVAVNIGNEAENIGLPAGWVAENTLDLWNGEAWSGGGSVVLQPDEYLILEFMN